MAGRNFLFVPGPTNVPDRVLRSMVVAMEDHRSSRFPALLYVDAVSSLGSLDFRMSEWKVDLAVTGSQKGLMLPAGLGIVCASPKALAAREQASCPRAFFDFGDMIKANATGYFPYTPSMPMLYGLRESLAIIAEEGLDAIFARHARLAEGVRA